MEISLVIFLVKVVVAALLIALASTVARRYPAFGALIASLPLVSILGMIFLWNERADTTNMAAHMQATFFYVLPSLPMFLIMPLLLRHGLGFYPTLLVGCFMTIVLYRLTTMLLSL